MESRWLINLGTEENKKDLLHLLVTEQITEEEIKKLTNGK